MQHLSPLAVRLSAICCNLQLTFLLLPTYICTHTHIHTHTYIVYIGALFCCRLQQMAVSLGTIGIEAIFAPIQSVAPLLSCNNYERN